jgi:predicted SnoaL-like aldol condensation-catalyzing enzyme
VQIEVIDIVRLEDGQIVEHWNVVDRLGLLQQLGALDAA